MIVSKQKKDRLYEQFRALGDPTRFELFKLLIKNKDICVSELAEVVDISIAGVSQQLKILEQAELIKRSRQGQKICYKLNVNSKGNKELLELINRGR